MKSLSIRLTDEDLENLNDLAASEDVTASAYLRDVIRSRSRLEPLRRAFFQWMQGEFAALDKRADDSGVEMGA